MSEYAITFDDVKAAGNRINGIAHMTPVLTSKSLIPNGKNYFFKVEALQKTGSFKFRGALNAVKVKLEEFVSSDSPSKSELSVVSHSSGNHAQALALAAQLATTNEINIKITVVMPNTVPAVKKAAVLDFGGMIELVDDTNEARTSAAEKIVERTGATFIHSSNDPSVIAGQGTVSLEMIQQVKGMGKDLDAVIIPAGGGGLAAGSAFTLRTMLGDSVKIILAEPAKLDDAHRSFKEGKLLKHNPDNRLDSVADGLKTTLGPHTWPIIRDMVDDVITVSEKEILHATKLVWERLKICIEPSAAVGVAVAMGEEFPSKYGTCENIGIILSGGNVDIVKIAKMMGDLEL